MLHLGAVDALVINHLTKHLNQRIPGDKMTQEVQPLTWSKRTNIEEHQQFFSKINEIIGNLAPTVDEAEQAIAQATAAIASANDAVATANAASAAASAAASQAQTAAATVAGYDGRLTAAEGDIDALQGRMTAAEAKNSQQDTAIAALQAADAQNVKISRINEYAVGLTGNQIIDGIKTFKLPLTVDRDDKAFQWIYFMTGLKKLELPTSTQNHAIQVRNNDGTERVGLHFDVDTNGVMRVYISGNATDGATSVGFNQIIMTISANGTVTPGW